MSGHKRAAAALHGLSKADQQWMLQQMSEPDRQVLQDYLQELEALGFEGQSAMMHEVQQLSAREAAANQEAATQNGGRKLEPVAPATPASALSSTEQLEQATPSQVLACLQDEPAALIARVLHIQQWPWQDALLAEMDVRQRLNVQRLMLQPRATAPRLDAALLDALAARLLQRPAAPAIAISAMSAMAAMPASSGQDRASQPITLLARAKRWFDPGNWGRRWKP